jgi:hypothetical protein
MCQVICERCFISVSLNVENDLPERKHDGVKNIMKKRKKNLPNSSFRTPPPKG